MDETIWIARATVIINVVQTLITIFALAVALYFGRKQIQIMLQQVTPAIKPPQKPIKLYLLLALCITLLVFTVFSVALHFIAFDSTPRLQSFTLMVNTLGIVFYSFVLKKIIEKIREYKRKT